MFKIIILSIALFSAVKANVLPEKRIVGGENAEATQLPYMVSIRPLNSAQHIAGGVLISQTWVVSSAQYLVDRAHGSLTLVFGIVDLTATGTSRPSTRIEINPSFDRNSRINDIALVQMASVPFSVHISSIYMHPMWVGADIDARVAGWGATNAGGGGNSQFLRRLAVRTLAACPTPPAGLLINANNFCAISAPTGSGICTTDVGGALVAVDGLIGIASWHNMPCGSSADVYVRISSFRNWIRSVTNV